MTDSECQVTGELRQSKCFAFYARKPDRRPFLRSALLERIPFRIRAAALGTLVSGRFPLDLVTHQLLSFSYFGLIELEANRGCDAFARCPKSI